MNIINILRKFTITFLTLFFLLALAEDIIYRVSPQTAWFEYVPPKVIVVEKGDQIDFHSNSEIKKDLTIEWFDTLWCTANQTDEERNMLLNIRKTLFENEVLMNLRLTGRISSSLEGIAYVLVRCAGKLSAGLLQQFSNLTDIRKLMNTVLTNLFTN